MTTVFLIRSSDQHRAVREALNSVVSTGETVHFLRSPTVHRLDPLIRDVRPAAEHGVEYTTDRLPEGYDIADLVEFIDKTGADRICVGISDRTETGKVRIDDLIESLLLNDRLSGDIVVGDDSITLDKLEYEA